MADSFEALAIDIGASNGRAVLGSLSSDGALSLHEVRRFANGMSTVGDTLRWDFDRLRAEIEGALNDCAHAGLKPVSVGINTWGVDYALTSKDGGFVDQPYAYRDKRNPPAMERFFKEIMSQEDLYAITGIQIMPFNTVYQLAAELFAGGERLRKADKILLAPDAFAFALCGKAVAEYTIASTTQMLDAATRDWSPTVLDKLGLSRELLPDVVEPGTRIGTCAFGEGGRIDVVAPDGHDTAAAVAAVPVQGTEDWAYVSSGTWSLVGVETTTPFVSGTALAADVTNEGGVCNTYRLLSNVVGMWPIQECMRLASASGTPLDIRDVCRDAAAAPDGGALIDPDHESFLAPDNMIEAITTRCVQTSQKAPQGMGELARCVFESLALKTRVVVERIGALVGTDPKVIHIVGGGSRNELLCQLTADALDRVVVAGPAEGTATGNFLMQAMSAGRIKDLAVLRSIVRDNTQLVRYEPSGGDSLRKRYDRFREIVS